MISPAWEREEDDEVRFQLARDIYKKVQAEFEREGSITLDIRG
jgi:hypothetical protein